MENKLENVDVKSASGVYFFVLAAGNKTIAGNDPSFRYGAIERWGGKNLPKGTYAFLFSVAKSGFQIDYINVFLRLNGIRNFELGIWLEVPASW